MLKMKKIMVTGAGGFLGGHLCLFFGQKDFEIAAVGRFHHGSDFLFVFPNIKFFSGVTLLDPALDQLVRKFKPDVVVHCAGTASVPFSVENPYIDFQRTVDLCAFTLETLRKNCPGAHFILLSSAAVYGNPTKLPICEETTLSPISPYAFHKKMMEILVREYSDLHDIRGSIIRIFSAYGEMQKKLVIHDVFHKFMAEGNEPLELFGTGEESRDFIHAQDVARAVYHIVDAEVEGVFNVASGKPTYIKDLVAEIHAIGGFKKEYSFSGSIRKGDPVNWEADISKLKALGFVPKLELSDGLIKYWNWLQAE
jgi:UDP-glucose 4-epimerase